MAVWVLAAVPLMFGIDADTMPVAKAKAVLVHQGFTQVSEPTWDSPKPKPNISAEEALEELDKALRQAEKRVDWFGVGEGDVRLIPPRSLPDVKHITLSSCPATGQLAMMSVTYKSRLSDGRFHEIMRSISSTLKQTPKVNPSAKDLIVEWRRPSGDELALASRISTSSEIPPLYTITVYGAPSTVECQRGFWLRR